MKIGIFETEHFEGAYPVIRLFDTPENELTIFTDIKTHRRFRDLLNSDADRYRWVIDNEADNRFSFFKKMHSVARKSKLDILYINTISKNHLLYALMIKFLRGSRVILTIHDINCLFESKFGPGLRQSIQHIGKKMLVKYVPEFNVVSDTMIPYLRQKTPRIIHNIPGAVFEHRIKKLQIENTIHIVVPGSIDQRRRDYASVFTLLEAAEKKQTRIHITLLGGPMADYGEQILNRAREFNGTFTGISCYHEQVVQQDEFDRKLDSAHFILIPSVVRTFICGNIPETYGITKSSGNIFDIIKHAKPFIAPETLVVSPELRNSGFVYNEINEIVVFLQELLNAPALYEDLSANAIGNSMKFTIDRVREKNPSLFRPARRTNQH